VAINRRIRSRESEVLFLKYHPYPAYFVLCLIAFAVLHIYNTTVYQIFHDQPEKIKTEAKGYFHCKFDLSAFDECCRYRPNRLQRITHLWKHSMEKSNLKSTFPSNEDWMTHFVQAHEIYSCVQCPTYLRSNVTTALYIDGLNPEVSTLKLRALDFGIVPTFATVGASASWRGNGERWSANPWLRRRHYWLWGPRSERLKDRSPPMKVTRIST